MTKERFNFITRDEFNAHEYKYDQKFDDLTSIMLGEFDKTHERSDRMEVRLDSIDVRLGTLSEDMRDVKLYMKNSSKRLASLENKFESVMSRLDNHDQKFELVMSKLDKHDEQFNEINRKLDAIIAK